MVIVLCNAPPDVAADLARGVVEARLAACVNLVPGVRSFYRWDGAVQDDAEVALWCKTTPEGVAALSDHLRAAHPYEVPEIVVVPVDVAASDPRYVAWVRAEVAGPEAT